MLKCLSININGIGFDFKRNWIKEIIRKNRVNIVGIQETKSESLQDFDVFAIWGNKNVGWETSPSVGNSGGLITMWDPKHFEFNSANHHRNYSIIMGTLKSIKYPCGFINTYAPQEDRRKRELWANLQNIITSDPDRCWIITGDFNEVRTSGERCGSTFSQQLPTDLTNL